MDGDFPWQYLALVLIAFLSWVFQKFQEATAERRRAHELRKRGTLPAPESRTEMPVPPVVVADALKDLMEALGGAPQQTAPPPLPPRKTPKPATKSKKSAAAKASEPKTVPALENPAPIVATESVVTDSPQPPTSVALRKLLATPAGLRQALILKEVLDKPLGLR